MRRESERGGKDVEGRTKTGERRTTLFLFSSHAHLSPSSSGPLMFVCLPAIYRHCSLRAFSHVYVVVVGAKAILRAWPTTSSSVFRLLSLRVCVSFRSDWRERDSLEIEGEGGRLRLRDTHNGRGG